MVVAVFVALPLDEVDPVLPGLSFPEAGLEDGEFAEDPVLPDMREARSSPVRHSSLPSDFFTQIVSVCTS